MRFKSSLKNASFSLVQILLRTVTNFILIRFIITAYGSGINGIDASIMNILNYLNLLQGGASAAAQFHLIKAFSVNNHQEICNIIAEINRIFKRIGWVMIFSLCVFAAIYPLSISDFANKGLIVQLILINGFSIISSYFFDGKYAMLMEANQKVYFVTIANIFDLVVGKCLAIILIILGYPFIFVKLCVILGTLIRIGILVILKSRHYPWLQIKGCSVDIMKFSEIKKDSKNVFVQQLTSMAFASTDILIISIFCGVGYASVYAVYNMVINGLDQLMSVLVDAPFASFGNALMCEEVSVARRIFNNYEHMCIIISTIFAACFLVLIDPFISIYTKGVSDINYHNNSLAICLGILFIFRYYRTLSARALNASGRFEIARRYYIIEMIINFGLSLVLVLVVGMTGVVLASIIAIFSSAVMMIIYVNGTMFNESTFPFVRKAVLNLILIAIITTIGKTAHLDVGGYLHFIIVGFIAFLLIGTVVMTINLTIWKETFIAIKKYLYVIAEMLTIRKREST